MRSSRFKPPPTPPPFLDFTKLTRDADKIQTTVTLHLDVLTRHEWMRLGACRLRERDSSHYRGCWQFAAYLKNATDFEHDSAFMFQMELIGVELTSVDYGLTSIQGWIRSDDVDDLRVPGPDYNPLRHKDTEKCERKECGEKHFVVPEGFYVPPPNQELFDLVRGKKVEIVTGYKWKETQR